jgi:hypothetical protein
MKVAVMSPFEMANFRCVEASWGHECTKPIPLWISAPLSEIRRFPRLPHPVGDA